MCDDTNHQISGGHIFSRRQGWFVLTKAQETQEIPISQKLLARNQPHASALPVRLREQLGGAMHLDDWDVLLK